MEQLPPTKSFRIFSLSTSEVYIYTDAFKAVGFRTKCLHDWFLGHWPSWEWRGVSIAVSALHPILAALPVWKDTIIGKRYYHILR